jgi:two-component system CheB/CheR fusion protein
MQVARVEDLSDYYDHLLENTDEPEALLGDLLISVTTFFRDAEAFEALATVVIPRLFAAKEASDTIRVWVPGCATGEEAYTIAILLLEEASRHEVRPAIQVFASDLDARALSTAREGCYPVAINADVNEERLRRFFTREGEMYRVRREVRDIVLFAYHSLLKDPPFSHIDMISCRNLLIYLDRELQSQALTTFHYALNERGYLFLGVSETADTSPDLFHTLDRKSRIYEALATDGPRLLPRLLGSLRVRDHIPQPRFHPAAGHAGDALMHRQALERMGPPSILVDSSHQAVHLSDSVGRFLQPPGGPLTGDVGDLVRPELRFEVRAALNRAFDRGEATLSLPIPVSFNGLAHRVYLQVRPIAADGRTSQAIVFFLEGEAVEPAAREAAPLERETDERIRLLTAELQSAEERLTTMREESEAANEELRAANEELQSINEEYRSTSEELETSKEELQSINEELQTVNQELKLKLDVVSRAHSDLQNLMAATDFGTIFLDLSLRIKRFTTRVTELFSITPNDEGRPITDFTHKLDYAGLIDDARAVLDNLTTIEREVRSQSGRWYLMRMRPYRTLENRIDGVVVSFLDITERRKTEDALRESEQRLRQEKRLVELSREPIFVWEFDGGILDWNRGSEELYGFSREEALGKTKHEMLRTEVPGSTFERLKEELLANGSWSGELSQKTKSGRRLTVESRLELTTLDDHRVVLESTRDVTERKLWEKRQELLLGELSHRVKNTLAIVQAIAHQTFGTSQSDGDFVKSFDGRLGALAAAHNLLVQSNWAGAELGEIARNQLEPYVSADPDRIAIEGPKVLLPADVATPLGLVFHELATNAAKFGTLSGEEGKVRLAWGLRNDPRVLSVVWREEGGPPVRKSRRKGFGSMLIKNGVPGAVVRHEMAPEGVVCTIELPLPETGDAAVRT